MFMLPLSIPLFAGRRGGFDSTCAGGPLTEAVTEQLTERMTETGPLRLSGFLRRPPVDERGELQAAGITRLSSLTPSLLQDLLSTPDATRKSDGLDLLEVMAAALRHGRALRLHVEENRRVIPLSVYPVEQLVFLPMTPAERDALRLNRLRLLQVEPAPDLPHQDRSRLWPLGLLLWELALRGSRDVLLPAIAAPAAYRIAPGAPLAGLDISGSLAMAVRKLGREAFALQQIAQWPGFDLERAIRLLNGLYLQAALVVTRAHPAAAGMNWASHRR